MRLLAEEGRLGVYCVIHEGTGLQGSDAHGPTGLGKIDTGKPSDPCKQIEAHVQRDHTALTLAVLS